MKKSIFERLIYGTPQWVLSVLVYGIGGGLLFLLLFTGCAPFEPIPGLCYTDKTGTYICPREEDCSHHEGVGWFICEDQQKEFDKWEACKEWNDAEVWSQCMLT